MNVRLQLDPMDPLPAGFHVPLVRIARRRFYSVSKLPVALRQVLGDDIHTARDVQGDRGYNKHRLANSEFMIRHGIYPGLVFPPDPSKLSDARGARPISTTVSHAALRAIASAR